MEHKFCTMMNTLRIHIIGRIDSGEKVISMCGEHIPNRPSIAFSDSAEETLQHFLGMATLAAVANVLGDCPHGPKKEGVPYGCSECIRFRARGKEWEFSPRISYINLTPLPAPCQCHCIYCNYEDYKWIESDSVKAAYDKMFDMLQLAKDTGLVLPDARWQISPGEITIHPYRERFLELVRGRRALFFTNGFIFDKDIARNLHDNPGSVVDLSIDSGTAETWRKIRGVDNFEQVKENLIRYRDSSAQPGQIDLKYIILPGINDNEEDFRGLREMMKLLGLRRLLISRDMSGRYHIDPVERSKLVTAVARLLEICYEEGLEEDLFPFTPEEREEARALAGSAARESFAAV